MCKSKYNPLCVNWLERVLCYVSLDVSESNRTDVKFVDVVVDAVVQLTISVNYTTILSTVVLLYENQCVQLCRRTDR